MKNNLFIISGPSGVGEDSIINGLEKIIPIERVITTTTREKRPREKEGNPYYFIAKEDFLNKIKKGDFFEWAKQYNNNLYGVTFEEIKRIQEGSKVGIWKIEYQGVKTAKEKIPGIKAILITAPLNQLKQRIENRGGMSQSQIKERMEYTKKWYKNKGLYDFEVVNSNGKLKESIIKTVNIIKGQLKVDNK